MELKVKPMYTMVQNNSYDFWHIQVKILSVNNSALTSGEMLLAFKPLENFKSFEMKISHVHLL